jgi:signal transduction histidine kinase
MLSALYNFLDASNLTPHGYCLFWRPELLWTHIISDGLIATAYYSIPFVLAVFVTKRPDVGFGWVFWAFAIFILACGTTHIFGIWTLFYPDYALEGGVKAMTAVASVLTAIGLIPLLPKALALPSPEQLKKANASLHEQIELKDRAVEALTRETAERIKIQDQLRHAQKMEVVGQLTAGIAHDFNNLLTVIIGNLDVIGNLARAKKLNGGDEAVNKCLDDATIGADRAAKLVHQLLAFGRRQPLAAQIVRLGELIERTADVLRRTLGENIRVITNLPALLPDAKIDEAELSAALLNVALNARDSMPRGGNLIFTAQVIQSSELATRYPELAEGQYVEITVSDTGCGMDADTAEKAFEPFFTTKPVGQGSGLGLSQVYGFARQSGGTAAIETALGAGTTIKVVLPQAQAPAPVQERTEGGTTIIEQTI